MWGCMKRFFLVPAGDDCQLSPCVEKQLVATTGKQSIVLLNGTDSKTYLIQLENIYPAVQRLYSYAHKQLCLTYTVLHRRWDGNVKHQKCSKHSVLKTIYIF